MKILALDTSTDVGSIALLEKDVLLALRLVRSPMRHLSWLTLAIQEMLKEAGTDIEKIEAIATGIGPGAFTGVRLQLATARTLAQVRGIPLFGVSSLDALAFQSLPFEGTIISGIDAKRQEVFAGIYTASGSRMKQEGDYLCLPRESLFKEISKHEGPYVLIGESNPYKSFLLEILPRSYEAIASAGIVLASSIGSLAYQRRNESSGDPYTVTPLYIRPSNAELDYEKTKVKKRI